MEETDADFENVEFSVVAKYLAIHLSPEEITLNNLKSVIPKRIKSGGPKPGIAYLDADLDKEKKEKWSWKGKERREIPQTFRKRK
jgi:hypothetical protein